MIIDDIYVLKVISMYKEEREEEIHLYIEKNIDSAPATEFLGAIQASLLMIGQPILNIIFTMIKVKKVIRLCCFLDITFGFW